MYDHHRYHLFFLSHQRTVSNRFPSLEILGEIKREFLLCVAKSRPGKLVYLLPLSIATSCSSFFFYSSPNVFLLFPISGDSLVFTIVPRNIEF
jgi:hypothetical protein